MKSSEGTNGVMFDKQIRETRLTWEVPRPHCRSERNTSSKTGISSLLSSRKKKAIFSSTFLDWSLWTANRLDTRHRKGASGFLASISSRHKLRHDQAKRPQTAPNTAPKLSGPNSTELSIEAALVCWNMEALAMLWDGA